MTKFIITSLKMACKLVQRNCNIPDFMSILSTLPYLANNRSSSDCLVSYPKFPTNIGLIVATVNRAVGNIQPKQNEANKLQY